MGLISWIKSIYYNNKLDNADRNYLAGDIYEAESLYLDILYTQPDAAEHLAKMYFEVGKSSKDELTYLDKLRSLLSDTSFGKENVSSYLVRLVLHIERTADALFNNHDYTKASKYLKAIECDNRGNTYFAKKYSLYTFYANLYAIEYEYSYETSLDSVYDYCKSGVNKDIEEAIVTTVQRLHTTKKLSRAFRLANCLAKKDNKDAIKECVSIAYDIYKSGKDTDKNIINEDVLLDYISKNSSDNLLIGLKLFAPFTDRYKKRYVEVSLASIASETDSSKAFALFKNAWQVTPDVSLIQTFAKPSSKISSNIFEYFVQNTGELDSKEDCINALLKELSNYENQNYALDLFEKFHKHGIDVEKYYKDVVNKIYANEDCDNRYKLKVLYEAHILFDDAELYVKFVSKGIETIMAENEETQAVSCFSEVWSINPDLAFLDTFVAEEYKYYKAIIEFLIEKSHISKWNKHIFSHFCDNVFAFDDYKYALLIFERLHDKKLSVQKPYVATVLKALPKLDTDTKLSLVNKSLTIFHDKYLIDEKLSIANVYLSHGNYEKSENTLKELVGLHTNAEPQLASLYYEEAKKTRSLDSKENFILKGLSFNSEHSSLFSEEGYKTIFKKLLRAYNSLIEKYCSTNDFDNAYRLCLGLKPFSNDWFDKCAEIKLLAVSQIKNDGSKIKEIRTFFNTLESDGINLKTVHTENICCLWDDLSCAQIQLAHTLPYAECVVALNDFISYVETHCEKTKSNGTLKGVKTELAALHKKEGYKYEQESKYLEATNVYDALYGIADTRTKSWCKIRSLICLIKQNKNVDEDDVRKSLSYVGFAKEKKDLSYRYGIWLIKHCGAKTASRFVNDFLSNENELVDFCHNSYIKEAEKTLADLNRKISRLKTREASLEEAQNLADNLSSYDHQISTYLPDVHDKIESLRRLITSYILSKCFEEENYELAMKLLNESGKNWYEDNIFFRNVAIVCLGMAETDKINRENYKLIISYWLTAVYRDQLFVSSLDYTSWDDTYTFTLENSLGGSKADAFGSLPENVNFDDPIDGSVIPIAEVQQSLLSRFELALNDKDNAFVSFYEEQKDAMNSLVNLNMDHPCVIAVPYLANTNRKCKVEIKKALDYEYENYGTENILKVGVLYNIATGNYMKFKNASNYAETCITAAKSMSVTKVRNAFTNDRMDTIHDFSGLYKSFSTQIQNVLTKVSKDGTISYKNVLNVFSIICDALHDNTISYIFGNFINQSVVSKLNDKNLDLASGLKDLVTAYQVAKSCTQLKNNIGNVLEALVGKYVTEADNSDLTTIKKVLRDTGTEFEGNVANALSEQIILLAIATGHADAINSLTSIPARSATLKTKLDDLKRKAKEVSINMELSNIIEKVNNKTIAYHLALQRVYDIYKVNQNNSRICDNLCTLIGICIREYVILDKTGKIMVMKVFNELKYNKSATYKTSAQALKAERKAILNQLPLKARTLLTGGTSLNSTLNAEGVKLKYALQLYLDLA